MQSVKGDVMDQQVVNNVKDYYGNVLDTKEDLKTSACCVDEAIPDFIKPILSQLHDDVMSKFYGCGSPIPLNLEGKVVLDLGCGTGRDCYTLSALVGESGHVIGVDMTDQQLDVAKEYQEYHREKFGYNKSNVTFVKGMIENLTELGIEQSSVDVVVSNCVLNLSTSKEAVFEEIFKVLKPGGELYFSDVFTNRRIPVELIKDPVLHGECLSGALYNEDFRRILSRVGCEDHREITSRILKIEDKEIAKKLEGITFFSKTIRAFKINLEDRCEDYGQVAYYRGGIENAETIFALDDHHIFELNKPMLVCSNTARMLKQSRFSSYFEVIGDESKHFGLFDCVPVIEVNKDDQNTIGGCC